MQKRKQKKATVQTMTVSIVFLRQPVTGLVSDMFPSPYDMIASSVYGFLLFASTSWINQNDP
jgi:hypothetical protein